MRKSRIIAHLQELDVIRRDEYMPQAIVEKVIDLEKILTNYLASELENPTPDSTGINGTSRSSSNNSTDNPLNGV